MAIHLDHIIVPSRAKVASAKLLAELLGVEWANGEGLFAPVYINDGLTFDFIETMEISTYLGGRGIYWNEPEGHQWEMLTVSYARPEAKS